MTTHVQLFGKPIELTDEPLPLSVTGVLDGYTAGEQYEGRLQINNSVGNCRVYIQAGTALPQDAVFSVDQVTKEVVLTWQPALAAQITTVPDGDFELGTGWNWGNGWRWNTGYDHISGNHSAGFADFKGDSLLVGASMFPVVVGQPINASVSVQQGGSSAGNVRAGVALQWMDSNRNPMNPSVGDIISSGSDGHWATSNIRAVVPSGAQWVSPAVFGNRKRQNALLWVDDFTWDLEYTQGQNSDDDFPVYLMVVDSLNRKAYWNGTLINYSINLTSQLYPIPVLTEELYQGFGQVAARSTEVPDDSAAQVMGVNAISTTATVAYRTVRVDEDKAAQTFGINSAATTVVVSNRTVSYGTEQTQQGFGVSAISTTVTASYRTITTDPATLLQGIGVNAISTTKV